MGEKGVLGERPANDPQTGALMLTLRKVSLDGQTREPHHILLRMPGVDYKTPVFGCAPSDGVLSRVDKIVAGLPLLVRTLAGNHGGVRIGLARGCVGRGWR